MTTTIQIRLDKEVKDKAKKTLHSMGLDLSSGVKIFLSQVVLTQSIPFDILSADYLPQIKKIKLISEANQALRSGKHYKSIKQAHRDILG